MQDLRLKALPQTPLGCDCVSFNPSCRMPSPGAAGGRSAGRTDAHRGRGGSKGWWCSLHVVGSAAPREDLLPCRGCTPSLPQLGKGSGHTGREGAFLPSYMASRLQRNNVGIQEARRALLMAINQQTALLQLPLALVPSSHIPQHPGGSHRDSPSCCCSC